MIGQWAIEYDGMLGINGQILFGADNTYLINKPFTKDGKISQVENSPDFIVISLTLVQGMMSSPT